MKQSAVISIDFDRNGMQKLLAMAANKYPEEYDSLSDETILKTCLEKALRIYAINNVNILEMSTDGKGVYYGNSIKETGI